MKKQVLFLSAVVCLFCSSCVTVFCGPITDCQRTKPAQGGIKRIIRPGGMIFDILTGGVWVAVDFATCSIYKPCATPGAAN
jgi:hypothetical protein